MLDTDSIAQPPETYVEITTLGANQFYGRAEPTAEALRFIRNLKSLQSQSSTAARLSRAQQRPRTAPSSSVQDIDHDFDVCQPFFGDEVSQ